ncbi:MAG: hypothetical protein ACOWWH_00590 [Eubacteriaceae bacterium]
MLVLLVVSTTSTFAGSWKKTHRSFTQYSWCGIAVFVASIDGWYYDAVSYISKYGSIEYAHGQVWLGLHVMKQIIGHINLKMKVILMSSQNMCLELLQINFLLEYNLELVEFLQPLNHK